MTIRAHSPLARARDVAALVGTEAAAIEAGRALTAPVLDALHDAGLFRTLLPRSLGGEELPPAEHVQVIEAIARADASTAWCLNQAAGCSMAAAYLAPDAAALVWGDPRAALAWGVGPGSTADAVPGGYLVTGAWRFASGSRHAGWLGGHCQLRQPDGGLVERTMLFPREAAAITDIWQVMGLRGTGSDSYAVAGLFVPDALSARRDTDAERREAGPLYRFSTTHLYAAGFGAVSLGIARAMLDAFVALAREKTPALTARALRDNSVVQHEVALAEARLRSARALLLQTLHEAWNGVLAEGSLSLEHRMAIRLASTYATHQAQGVVQVCWQQAGASAIFEGGAFERRFRDMHAVTQQVQARSAHFETVGEFMLGGEAGLRFV